MKEDEMYMVYNTQGKMRNAYKILTGKPEGMNPLGRPRRRLR
jgi:hypothetical protein